MMIVHNLISIRINTYQFKENYKQNDIYIRTRNNAQLNTRVNDNQNKFGQNECQTTVKVECDRLPK